MSKMYMHIIMCIEITSSCTAVNQAVGYVDIYYVHVYM